MSPRPEIDELLQTNAVPSSHAKQIVLGSIYALDLQIFQLDEIIASLEVTLKEKKAKRAACSKQRASYKNILSPLREMPSEILSEIFLWANPHSKLTRIYVSQVCQRWRTAAISTSALWTSISYDNSWMGTNFIDTRTDEYISLCLQRSGSRPLDMKSSTTMYTLQEAPDTLLEAMKTRQWRRMAWASPQQELSHIISGLHEASYGTLEELVLDNSKHPSGGPVQLMQHVAQAEAASRMLTISPAFRCLSKLKLKLCYPLEYGMIDAPWARLTWLSLVCPCVDRPETVLGILRMCLQLELFELSLSRLEPPSAMWLQHERKICLPNLRGMSLRIGRSSTSMITIIAGLLITPALNFLILHHRTGVLMPDIQVVCLYHYLLACSSTLRRLVLSGCGPTELAFLVPALNLLEDLVFIGMSDAQVDDYSSLSALKVFVCNSNEPSSQPSSNGQESDDAQAKMLSNGKAKEVSQLRQEFYASLYPLSSKWDDFYPLPNLRTLHFFCHADAGIQKLFIEVIESRWWPEDMDQDTLPVARIEVALLQNTRSDYETCWVLSDIEYLQQRGLDIDVMMHTEKIKSNFMD